MCDEEKEQSLRLAKENGGFLQGVEREGFWKVMKKGQQRACAKILKQESSMSVRNKGGKRREDLQVSGTRDPGMGPGRIP